MSIPIDDLMEFVKSFLQQLRYFCTFLTIKCIHRAGIHAPPTSVSGEPLPGSRLISIVMFPDVPIPDPVWTLITMTWGQIVTHDMSMSMGTTQASKCTILLTCNSYNHKRYSGIL